MSEQAPDAGAPPAASTGGSSGGTVAMKEWEECRTSIARFDKIIVDLRKYGFTIITGLLTADVVLFVKSPGSSRWTLGAISAIMMILTYALFTVDRHYEVFLQAAVQRAEELERGLRMHVTEYIGTLTRTADTDAWGSRLYTIFLLTSLLLPLASWWSAPPKTEAEFLDLVAVLLAASFLAYAIWVTMGHRNAEAKAALNSVKAGSAGEVVLSAKGPQDEATQTPPTP